MYAPLSVSLETPPDSVAGMLATDQYQDLFQVRNTRSITWGSDGPTHVIGKISYLKNKNLSGVRFHVHLEPIENGSRATIAVEPRSFFLRSRWIVYALGLLMCGVGVLFPLVGFSMFDKRVAEIQSDVANALSRAASAET